MNFKLLLIPILVFKIIISECNELENGAGRENTVTEVLTINERKALLQQTEVKYLPRFYLGVSFEKL